MKFRFPNIFKIFNNSNMATITINGKTTTVNGNNIQVINDRIIVNGKVIESGLSGIVKVEFTGDLANLDATNAVVNGNVKGDVDSTNITVNGDIGGDVDATNVTAKVIHGNVDAVSVRH